MKIYSIDEIQKIVKPIAESYGIQSIYLVHMPRALRRRRETWIFWLSAVRGLNYPWFMLWAKI